MASCKRKYSKNTNFWQKRRKEEKEKTSKQDSTYTHL